MRTPALVWADLRIRPFTSDLHKRVHLREPGEIPNVIADSAAAAVCFEYDEPNPKRLEPLERVRVEWPELPVLMLTVEHSEDLAVWALRMRVWDYIVLPIEERVLLARIAVLVGAKADNPPSNEFAGNGVSPIGPRTNRPASIDGRKKLLPAISYVEANYSERVALGVVACMCGLGRYQFSRIFKAYTALRSESFSSRIGSKRRFSCWDIPVPR